MILAVREVPCAIEVSAIVDRIYLWQFVIIVNIEY